MRGRFQNRGFTLVEALVSMTILAVGIIGILSAFSLSSRSGSEIMRLAKAAEIADKQLQLVFCSGGSGLASQGVSGPYKWEIQTAELHEGLQRTSVVVTWSDRRGMQSFKLSEIFLPHSPTTD